MRISVLPALCAGLLFAQPPAKQAIPPTKPEDLASISGQVLNGVTGEPLRRVSITLNRADPPSGEPPVTYLGSTTATGQFTMKDLEPGKYQLHATRNGFVAISYGARSPRRPGTTLSLARGQNMTELTLKMTPHAVITGRILDEEGEPVVNARVMLEGHRYVNGRKQLVTTGGGAMSNDLGEYRIFGIPPGKFLLSATPMMTAPTGIDRTNGPEEGFVPTYHPGTTDPATAAPVEIAAGAQVRGLDLALVKTRTGRVKGKVVHGLPGRPNIQIMLMPRNTGGYLAFVPRSGPADPGGNFDIRNVTPGAYILTANVNDGSGYRQGRLPVDVGSSTIEGLNVVVGPGVAVRGHVRSDAEGQPFDLSNVRFTLSSREMNMYGGSQAKPDAEGAFEMKSVTADHFNLTWYGLPAGAYVKSARSDQTDVLVSGLDLSSGAAPAPLEIVLSPRAATVTGVVQDAKTGNPAPGATVVLAPQEKERKDQQSFYKTVVSDQHGAFSLPNLPPGEYKAYAWEDLEPGAFMDPDIIKAAEGKSESLTLREGDQKTLPLKMIPADGGVN